MKKLSLVAVLFAFAPMRAWAGDAKCGSANDRCKRDQSAVKVDVKLTDKTKPIQKTENKSEVRPELNSDSVLKIEENVNGIRIEEEQSYAILIKETPDDAVDEKSDLYFRLGELYAKQQRLYRLKSAESAIAADKKGPNQAKFKQAADAYAAKAKEYMLKAVKVYSALTGEERYRNYSKMDMALFYFGYTLTSAKYMKEARQVYDKLLKNYPSSKYVPEAHLAFGDYFFEQNQLADAEARYKAVLKFPKSAVYWYAMYKLGWVDLNLSRFVDALDTFSQVANATKNSKKDEVLNRASKKDFVRAYAEVGKADKAFQAFQRVDQKYAFDMLQILADLYLAQGKSDKAIYVYRELMQKEPKNKNVCLWEYNVAHAYLSMPGASNADKVAEIERLVHLWGVLKTGKVLPDSDRQECHDNAAAMSGELARAYHSESAKTKNPETLAYAEKLYKVYLDVFPDAEDFAQTQYFYAELQWSRAENEKNQRLQTELWEHAAVTFTDVVKTGKVGDKLLKEAAYAAVLGWRNSLNVDPRQAGKDTEAQSEKEEAACEKDQKLCKKPEPKQIPEKELKMLGAFDIYIKYIKDPNDDELVGMKFLKANIYRRYNHFDEFMPMCLDIVEHHRNHETAEFCANLMLDTYRRLGEAGDMSQFEKLGAFAEKLDKDGKFLEGKEDLKARLVSIRAKARSDIALAAEKEAKAKKDFALYVVCGNKFLDIYNANPEDKNNAKILYNAGVCFSEGKSLGTAIRMFNLMERFYPKAPETARAVAQLGKIYGDIAFYKEAAEKLEQYAKQYTNEKDETLIRPYDAMSNAVFYRKGIGDDAKAIDDTKWYIGKFRDRVKDSAAAKFSLTTVYEKQAAAGGDKDAVIKNLREYIGTYGEKGGSDRLVKAWAKIGQIYWDRSCPVKTVDGSCVKVTRERAIASKKVKKTKKGKEVYVAPVQCGPESKIKLSVVKRDERNLRDALNAFKAAEQAFDKHQGKTGGDEGGARYYYAVAKFAQADVAFEKYLDIKFPTNLNYGDGLPEHKKQNEELIKKSTKRFEDWLKGKGTARADAEKAYLAVLNVKDAANSIAAAARLGQVAQDLSDQLYTAEIPQDVRRNQVIEGYDIAQDKVDNYCDALAKVAEPLEATSLDAFGACLAKSTELGWFSEWSKLCEKELGQIKPEDFPTAAEIHADPGYLAPIAVPEPAQKLQ
jgi:TolA-binding protein